ncbi:hypothetical protein YC2023_023291 [Brassica napus]
MPLWRETSVELSSLRSKGLHPCGQCWICFCALRSKGSLAVSVLLRPFSFEGRRRLEEIMVLSRGSQLLTGVRIRDIKSEQKWTADSGDTAVLSLAIVNLPVGVRPSKNLNSNSSSDTASTLLPEKYADFTQSKEIYLLMQRLCWKLKEIHKKRWSPILGCSTEEEECSRGDGLPEGKGNRLVAFPITGSGGFISTKVIDGLQISGKEMPAVKEGSIQSQVRYSLDISKMDGDMDSSSV